MGFSLVDAYLLARGAWTAWMRCRVGIFCLATALVVMLPLHSADAGTIEITTEMVIDAGNSFPDDRLIVKAGIDGPPTISVLDGGVAGGIRLEQMSHVEMTGGTLTGGFRVPALQVTEGSTALVSGGLLTGGGTIASGDGSLILTGEVSVAAFLIVETRGRVLVSGGTLSGPITVNSLGDLEITGGNIHTDITAILSGNITVSGGDFFRSNSDPVRFRMLNFSTLHVRGFDLTISNNVLTGILEDGRPLNNPIEIDEHASVVLWNIPEPGSLTLLLFAFYFIAQWRFRRSSASRKQHF